MLVVLELVLTARLVLDGAAVDAAIMFLLVVLVW